MPGKQAMQLLTDVKKNGVFSTLFPQDATGIREIIWDVLSITQDREGWGRLCVDVSPDAAKCLSVRAVSMAAVQNRIASEQPYILVHQGRYVTSLTSEFFSDIARTVKADVITLHVTRRLSAFSERPCLGEDGRLVGLSRPYEDSIEPVAAQSGPFHHLMIKKDVLSNYPIRVNQGQDVASWLTELDTKLVNIVHLEVPGKVIDVSQERGLLALLETSCFSELCQKQPELSPCFGAAIGAVFAGKEVQIAPDAIVIGPAILGDGVTIESGAIIKKSILGPNTRISENQRIQGCIIPDNKIPENPQPALSSQFESLSDLQDGESRSFRRWPEFSYVSIWKRMFDILFSLAVLTLSLPLFPIVAVVIKITSPGPLFYRARRQGLHGRAFDCLKFRSMIVKADALQDRLRVVNQVDGPQFKIEDDPRITGVGKFLRDTCIDEIPQFINVLLGQMSVVGPRPSPESENRNCPIWRDARLSVRPGITGLWQICRTRQIGMDFQEWVYYDMEYVRHLSVWMDIRICLRTVMHLFMQFIKQF